MIEQQPFKWRHFEAEIILLCMHWYLRYALSYRGLEEVMRELRLVIDHTTICRWMQRYAPELEKWCNPHLRFPGLQDLSYEWLGLSVLALRGTYFGQIVERVGDVGMIGPQRLFPDAPGSAEKGFGLLAFALGPADQGQVVQGPRHFVMLSSSNPFANEQGSLLLPAP